MLIDSPALIIIRSSHRFLDLSVNPSCVRVCPQIKVVRVPGLFWAELEHLRGGPVLDASLCVTAGSGGTTCTLSGSGSVACMELWWVDAQGYSVFSLFVSSHTSHTYEKAYYCSTVADKIGFCLLSMTPCSWSWWEEWRNNLLKFCVACMTPRSTWFAWLVYSVRLVWA